MDVDTPRSNSPKVEPFQTGMEISSDSISPSGASRTSPSTASSTINTTTATTTTSSLSSNPSSFLESSSSTREIEWQRLAAELTGKADATPETLRSHVLKLKKQNDKHWQRSVDYETLENAYRSLVEDSEENNSAMNRTCMDPLINANFKRMQEKIETLEKDLEAKQNELVAMTWGKNSVTGTSFLKRLRKFQSENEEQAKELDESRASSLEKQLALRRKVFAEREAEREADYVELHRYYSESQQMIEAESKQKIEELNNQLKQSESKNERLTQKLRELGVDAAQEDESSMEKQSSLKRQKVQ